MRAAEIKKLRYMRKTIATTAYM